MLMYTNAEVTLEMVRHDGLHTARVWMVIQNDTECAGVGRLSCNPRFSMKDYPEFRVADSIKRFRSVVRYYLKQGFKVTRQLVEEVRG